MARARRIIFTSLLPGNAHFNELGAKLQYARNRNQHQRTKLCFGIPRGLMSLEGASLQLLSSEFLFDFLDFLTSSSSHCVSQGPAVKDVVSKVWLLSHLFEGPKETMALFESPKIL